MTSSACPNISSSFSDSTPVVMQADVLRWMGNTNPEPTPRETRLFIRQAGHLFQHVLCALKEAQDDRQQVSFIWISLDCMLMPS
jgi:hypothetical protein